MRLTDDEIRRITMAAIEEMGENATPELVKKAVAKSIEKLGADVVSLPKGEEPSGRLILTSFGLNQTGVVAKITQCLSEANCDIHDISQKLMGDFFTMIMICDLTNATKDLNGLQQALNGVADDLKIKIYVQHEDLFRKMHRI